MTEWGFVSDVITASITLHATMIITIMDIVLRRSEDKCEGYEQHLRMIYSVDFGTGNGLALAYAHRPRHRSAHRQDTWLKIRDVEAGIRNFDSNYDQGI